MSHLVLVRHGKSEWNALGLWTGWEDRPLNDEGREDAKKAASVLYDIEFHVTHSSKLKRVTETLDIIRQELKLPKLPHKSHEALNERHYGIYTGKNKWQVKEEVGEEEFKKIRRSWNHPIPEGETMEDVYNRVVPYFQENILPDLKQGKNVLVASSGNTLRALVKYIEDLSNEDLANLEFGVAEVWAYEFNNKGEVLSKEIKSENPQKGKI